MTTYSYGQLQSLWLDAAKGTGYATDSWARLMAAIAEAESSGRSDAYNASGASGLWQILGAVHPDDQPHLFDPQVNAHEALLKLQSQGLGAWVTYTSGAYEKYIKDTGPASLPDDKKTKQDKQDKQADQGSGFWPLRVVDAFGTLDSAVGGLWGVLTALLSPSTYVRAAAGLAGLLLLALGMFALYRAVA